MRHLDTARARRPGYLSKSKNIAQSTTHSSHANTDHYPDAILNPLSRPAHTPGYFTRFLRFPFNNFRYSLTLFSKFFASFPHGTCLLSVYHLYLALDGVYHLIRSAFPSKSTLQRSNARHSHKARTGVSPSSLNLSRKLC